VVWYLDTAVYFLKYIVSCKYHAVSYNSELENRQLIGYLLYEYIVLRV